MSQPVSHRPEVAIKLPGDYRANDSRRDALFSARRFINSEDIDFMT